MSEVDSSISFNDALLALASRLASPSTRKSLSGSFKSLEHGDGYKIMHEAVKSMTPLVIASLRKGTIINEILMMMVRLIIMIMTSMMETVDDRRRIAKLRTNYEKKHL